MNKLLKYIFSPQYIFLCHKCHKITETYFEQHPICKCTEELGYADRISETTRTLLEIKGEFKDE